MLSVGASIWTPTRVGSSSLTAQVQALFGGSDQGVMLDLTSAAYVYQTNDTSTPITTTGQTIGYATDLSGKSNPAVQATAGNRPTFRGVPKTLGADGVTNGRFATDTVWTKGTGWTIASNLATKTAGTAAAVSQSFSFVAGTTYMVHVRATRTAGTFQVQFTGGTTVSSTARSATGSWIEVMTAVTGNATLGIQGDSAFAGSVSIVECFPVTAFDNVGGDFDGAVDFLRTASVNLSGSNKATVVFVGRYTDDSGARTSFDVGNYYGSAAGSFAGLSNSVPMGRLRGPTGAAGVSVPAAEGAAGANTSQQAMSFAIDLSQATVLTQVSTRVRGILPAQTASGTPAGGGNMVNGEISLGISGNGLFPWKDLIHRLFVINRTLTTDELAIAERWAKQGMAYCAVIGDSTTAFNNAGGGLPANRSVASLTGGMICHAAEITFAGDKIADQKTKWTALAGKTALQAVFIQVGLNDINTYIGVSKTTAQIIADLQDLVNTVNADKPAGCKTYISALTPCKAWIGVSTGQTAAAYAAWLDVNTAISGGGATPITGVDRRITSHVALLNDGSGNLLPAYDSNADGVHENGVARQIIGQAWRAALEADGLV